jgi:hypothetical protein
MTTFWPVDGAHATLIAYSMETALARLFEERS